MEDSNWPKQQLFTLKQTARAAAIGAAGACVKEAAISVGFCSRTATQLRLAVEEAVSNVVLHAYNSHSGLLEVTGEDLGSGLRVSVRDWGRPMYELHEQAAHGLHRIRDLIDKIELHNLGQGGKELVLTKNLRRSVEHPDHTDDETGGELTVRDMVETDAPKVCECFYAGYGYSYAHADLYYPERLLELAGSARLTPVVSVTPKNRVVGFSALVKEQPEDTWGELAMAIVHPDFRGHHLFDRMFSTLAEKARLQGLDSLYAHAVSVHPISQHVLHKLGMKDTAIMLGFAPPTEVSLQAGDTHRQTFVIEAMRLKDHPRRPVFYAGRHQAMIAEILEGMDYHPEFRTEGKPTQEHSLMTTTTATGLNIASFSFHQIGDDAPQMVTAALRQMCLRHIDVVQLYAHLTDPGLVELLPVLERLGFFFAGVHPGWAGGDALVVQYLNNFEVDPSTIQLELPQTRRLLNYVLECQEKALAIC